MTITVFNAALGKDLFLPASKFFVMFLGMPFDSWNARKQENMLVEKELSSSKSIKQLQLPNNPDTIC